MLFSLYHRVSHVLLSLAVAVNASPMQFDIWFHRNTTQLLPALSKRLDEAASTFSQQFESPAEVLGVLLIIGGDVVQKAIAQLSGGWITPVSFSFGWVAYTFTALLSAFGDGVYLPQPDMSAKIITVGSGITKTNESWIIARLIRDLELDVEQEYRKEPWRLKTSLMISVYDSMPDIDDDSQVEKDEDLPPRHIKKDWIWYSYFVVCLLQLGIAAVPLYESQTHRRNWSIILITGAGIILAVMTGSSWQFRIEKFACRRNSVQDYLLTRGNGHKHVFLIRHRKAHNTRWPRGDEKEYLGVSLQLDDLANTGEKRASWGSRLAALIHAILWILFLITVGGQTFDTWFLFAVGSIGMAHNIMTASVKRDPAAHGFPLRRARQTAIQNSVFGQPANNNAPRPKVMRGLWQLEQAFPGAGIALLPEFFPSGLREGKGTAIGDRAGRDTSEKEEWDGLKDSLKKRKNSPALSENKAAPIPGPVAAPQAPLALQQTQPVQDALEDTLRGMILLIWTANQITQGIQHQPVLPVAQLGLPVPDVD